MLGLFNRGLAYPLLDGWMALLSLATTSVPLLTMDLLAGPAGIALLGRLGRAATKLSFPAKRD